MKKSGFTLSETLITLAILGVIAAIGIPQVVTMAQQHKNEAIRSKVVYQMELGVQKLISDTNRTSGNFSAIDKLMLIDNWPSKLLRHIDVSSINTNSKPLGEEINSAKDAQANTIANKLASAINTTNKSKSSGVVITLKAEGAKADAIANKITSAINKNNLSDATAFVDLGIKEKMGKLYYLETNYNYHDQSDHEIYINQLVKDINNAAGDIVVDTIAPTIIDLSKLNSADYTILDTISTYRINHLGAEIKFSKINNAKSAKADDIAFEVMIDTNGDKKPNKEGVDQFTYSMKNSGKMVYTGVQN